VIAHGGARELARGDLSLSVRGMDLVLSGKNALVTGASKGIGLAVTRALVAEGVFAVTGARSSSPALRELAEAGHVREIQVDLASAAGPARLVDAALEHGALDIVVNNVGAVTPRLGGFLSITDDEWLDSFNLTFFAAVRTIRAALPAMVAEGRGTIVNNCSVNAFLPDPGVMDYSAAKAALANFSKSLSKEVGPSGIRVNTVSPGPVSTDLWLGDHGVAAAVAGAQGGDAGEVARQQASHAATGRFTTPEEVADLVVLLASERAANVTGSDFVIDGGLVTTL
jgi:NAD(P)-dependent dehydrogenase (short-subunit alcohol dehydrogenase family)